MKLLVTGCQGFIASHFCARYLADNPEDRIVGLSRNTRTKNMRRLDNIFID